jgi:hypothetical protein
MKKNREAIAPVVVATGPVKEVIIRGDAIDQTEFPVPKWHYLEGGRYIHTFSGIVSPPRYNRSCSFFLIAILLKESGMNAARSCRKYDSAFLLSRCDSSN